MEVIKVGRLWLQANEGFEGVTTNVGRTNLALLLRELTEPLL
jgi:hypothetical protein